MLQEYLSVFSRAIYSNKSFYCFDIANKPRHHHMHSLNKKLESFSHARSILLHNGVCHTVLTPGVRGA